MIESDRIYTTQEVAKAFKVSVATISRAIRVGKLKAVRVGGQWRILGADFIDYVDFETQAALQKPLKAD
jgi:excisionase family DNA binding protein